MPCPVLYINTGFGASYNPGHVGEPSNIASQVVSASWSALRMRGGNHLDLTLSVRAVIYSVACEKLSQAWYRGDAVRPRYSRPEINHLESL